MWYALTDKRGQMQKNQNQGFVGFRLYVGIVVFSSTAFVRP